MMTLTAWRWLSGFAALACLLAHPARAADWQIATAYPAANFHTENLQSFADGVAAATRGAVRITIHPNGSLLKMGQIPEAVAGGKVQAGEVMLSSMAREAPVMGIDSVPFLVDGYGQAMRLWQESRTAVDAALARRGLRLLYAVPWPPQGLYTNKAVLRASSLRGMRMRTYNPATDRIAQMVGAEPVLVQAADLTGALEAGRIDTLISSSATAIDMAPLWKWFPYFYEINAWLPKNVVFVGKAAFDALDPDSRAAILKLAAEAEARGWRTSEEKARNYNRQLADKGTRILAPDPFMVGDFRRLGETLSREWLREAGAEGLDVLLRYELSRFQIGATSGRPASSDRR
jgi:TRAP-type C4-dicarboxylate transport system substrate-binding protein